MTATSTPASDLLNSRIVLSLTELSSLLGMDRSTLLRKEREKKLPSRRIVAGRSLFLTADIRSWLDAAEPSAVNKEHAARSREVASKIKEARIAAATTLEAGR